MRRQLRERAQRAGVKLEPVIEVEYMTAALDLAQRGLGDTIADRAIVASRGLARRLVGVAFEPPLYETFAFITRRNAHLSPATRAFMGVAEKRVAALRRQARRGAGRRARTAEGAALCRAHVNCGWVGWWEFEAVLLQIGAVPLRVRPGGAS